MTSTASEIIHESIDLNSIPKEKIQKEDLHWAVILLRCGVCVYGRRESDSPRARQLLKETAQAVYGDEQGEAVLREMETQAQEDTSLPEEALEKAKGAEGEAIIVAATLMYLAVVDRDWSMQQKEYLSTVIPRLIGLDAADLLNWVHGSWPRERYRIIDSPLQNWTSSEKEVGRKQAAEVLSFAKQNRRVDVATEEFNKLWENVYSHVSGMQSLVNQLGPSFKGEIDRSVDALQQMKQIRVVVLGEFNVGKSTSKRSAPCLISST